MDKRVKTLFRKNLFDRVQGIAAFGVIMSLLYGVNYMMINAGLITVKHGETVPFVCITLAFLEFMIIALSVWLVRDALDDAKRVVREQDFQKELDQKYGSTAK